MPTPQAIVKENLLLSSFSKAFRGKLLYRPDDKDVKDPKYPGLTNDGIYSQNNIDFAIEILSIPYNFNKLKLKTNVELIYNSASVINQLKEEHFYKLKDKFAGSLSTARRDYKLNTILLLDSLLDKGVGDLMGNLLAPEPSTYEIALKEYISENNLKNIPDQIWVYLKDWHPLAIN